VHFKNGFCFVPKEKLKDGFHFHRSLAVRLGDNYIQKDMLHIDKRLGAGVYVPINFKKVNKVKLNNFVLTPKIDYIAKDSKIAFTFNLNSSDKIEIEGTL